MKPKTIHKYYFKSKAKHVPFDTIVYKEWPNENSRHYRHQYLLTDTIVLFKEGRNEVTTKAKKMYYMIQQDTQEVSFIMPDDYVVLGFDEVEDFSKFLTTLR
jgi:hypothetical protein